MPLTVIAGGMFGSLLLTGYVNELSFPFYIGIGAISSQLIWQIWTADLNNSANLWQRFNSNKYVGAAVSSAIIAGKIF